MANKKKSFTQQQVAQKVEKDRQKETAAQQKSSFSSNQGSSKQSTTKQSSNNKKTSNASGSAKSYTGMTQEKYNQLRKKGYTQKQIEAAYMSKAPEMNQELYNKLRNQGYTQKQIEKGQYDREFMIPWQTAETAGKDLGSWGDDINSYNDWSKGNNDISKWDTTMATAWADKFNNNAARAKKYMQQLAAAGLSRDTEEYKAYKDYFDYFSKAARDLNKSNESFYDYRKNFMYDAGYGQYLTYDQAKDKEKQLRKEAETAKNTPAKFINTTMGAFIDPEYQALQQSGKKKEEEADAYRKWIAEQDENRNYANWYTRNLGYGQDSEQVYQNADKRYNDAAAKLSAHEQSRPDYYNYAITDDLGNIIGYDDEAYKQVSKPWQDEYDRLIAERDNAEKLRGYAEANRFNSVIKDANINSPEVRAAIERGKLRDAPDKITVERLTNDQPEYEESWADRLPGSKTVNNGINIGSSDWFQNVQNYLGKYYPNGIGGSSQGQSSPPPIAEINKNMYASHEALYHADPETWSEDKLNAYYLLRDQGNDEAADRLAKITNDAIAHAEIQQEVFNHIDEFQASHPVIGGAAATAAGVAVPLVMGIPEFLAAVDMYMVTGDIDQNALSLMPTQLSSRAVGNTAKQLNNYGTIDNSVPIIGGKGAGDAYQLGISILQSALSRKMGGLYTEADPTLIKMGVSGFTLTQFFGSAASNGIFEGLDNGMDAKHALMLGTMNGFNEAIGEVVSLDKLISMRDTGMARDLIRDVLVQMGIEGSEEAFTTVLNTIADMMVNGDKNDLQKAISEYESQGRDPESARKQAIKDWLNGLAFDFVGGAISGGVSAGGTHVRNNIGTYHGQTRYVMDLAEQTAEGSRSREMLTGIQDEYAKNQERKKPSRRNISAYRGNQFAAQVKQDLIDNNTDTAVRAIEEKLTQLGETGDVHAKAQVMADAIISDMSGEEAGGFDLTPSSQFSANATANMRQVMNELNQARDQYVNYAKPNEEWYDPIMKGRFLDQRVLSGDGYASADYYYGRAAEKNLNLHTEQIADLEQSISDARKELDKLSPKDNARRAELNDQIREAEKAIKSHQEAILKDGYNSYSEEEKAASVEIDGTEYTVSGLTQENGDTKAKLTDADGNSITVGIDDERLPNAFRSLALKARTLGWAADKAFERYKPGTDISDYVGRIQNILSYASEQINRESFMNSRAVKALNDQVLAEYLYGKGQDLLNARQLTDESKGILNKLSQGALEKARNELAKTKGKGKVDTTSGWTMKDGTHFDGIQGKKLSDKQNAVVKMIDHLSNYLNLDYVIFDGDAMGVQGWYKDGIVGININAGLSSSNPRVLAAEAVSHEITHFIEEFAPEEYEQLRAAVVAAAYENNPELFERRVQAKMRQLSDQYSGDELHEMAVRELVADACTTMLKDSKMVTELARQNMTLAQKMADFIQQTIAKIKQAIDEAFADTDMNLTRREVDLIKNKLDEIQERWDSGLEAAAFYYNAYKTMEPTKIGSMDFKNYIKAKNTNGQTLFQVAAFEHDEPEYRAMLKQAKMSDDEIDDLFDTIDRAMDIIKGNLEALDYAWEADIDDRGFSPVKPNSDKLYKVSQDFSTLCRKRILQGAVANQLQAALNRALTRDEGIAIRDALMAIQSEGKQIEVACALCYVEAARMRSPVQIQKFLDNKEKVIKDFFAGQDRKAMKQKIDQAELDERQKIYEEQGMVKGKGTDDTMYDVRDPKAAPLKKLPGKMADRIREAKKAAKATYAVTAEQQKIIDTANSMTVSDFTSPEGLENLAKNHREIFDAYTSFIRNATNSKGIENDTWWRAGDSAKISDLLIRQMNDENGLRTQSWSDFQVKHLMDYIAATIELSTRGAKQHAYTKVIDYVDLMGDTGVMINMSLIPTREYSGKLEYDNIEGFVAKEAKRLREKYHKTAGTICIGVDDNQIIQLLASDFIDYVIPYHNSGMAAHTRAAMHIPSWTNYQDFQGEKKLTGKAAEDNAARFGVQLLEQTDPMWHESPNFSDWYNLDRARQIAQNTGKTGKYGVMTGGYAAMQDAARNYMQICAERGLAPKFSYGRADFSGEENYWKLLIDRKMVDNVTGDIIEQEKIQPRFDFNTIERILNDELDRYGKVKADQNEATRRVTEAFLSGKIKAGMSSETIADVMQKPVDNISITNITQNNIQYQSYDYSKSFEEQIDDWKAGLIPQRDTLVLGGTPEIWKRVGFNSLPVTINQTHVNYAINGTKDQDHFIGETVLKDMPNLIAKPVAIIQSQSDPSRAVVIVNKQHNGKSIIAAIEVDGYGELNSNRIDSNAITSVLGKTNALRQLSNAITHTINGSPELFYWDKNIAVALLQGAGNQFSGRLPQGGYVHSIDDSGSTVKKRLSSETESTQFKKWFKNSKIVDEDGKPLVVYHGTDADFTVFDISKGRSTMDIQGAFFSPWEIEAGGYGSNVGAYYLSIQNPAPEGVAYKALNRFKGQNNAGIKAREYLESLGYDGVANYDEYIAFYPEQIKSATDNIGTFDRNNPDIRYQQAEEWDEGPIYNHRALVSDQTLDRWMDAYAATNPNYAQAYITYMNPDDFLKMTTSDVLGRMRIEEQSEGFTPEQVVKASKGQPIFLDIDTETGKVTGHEGRHRMVALRRQGITEVPVLLFDFSTKYSKTPLSELKLTGQDFGDRTNRATATVKDLTPLSTGNKQLIADKYGKQTSTERISDKVRGTQSLQFQMASDEEYINAVNRGNTEDVQRMVDDAAKAAGYTTRAFHGSPHTDISVFDINRAGENTGVYGDRAIWFTDSESFADDMSYQQLEGSSAFRSRRGSKGKVYDSYLRINNPFEIQKMTPAMRDILWEMNLSKLRSMGLNPNQSSMGDREYFFHSIDTALEAGNDQYVKFYVDYSMLQEAGYDAIIARLFSNGKNDNSVEYGVFSPEQIKSAEPITYDQNGNVVPLSQRFNSERPEIQYQMYDSSAQDSMFEAEERQKAWTDLQAENEVLKETVDKLNTEIKKLAKRNEGLNKQLGITKPEIRISDARKLADEIIGENFVGTRKARTEYVNEIAAKIKEMADFVMEAGTKNINELDYDELRGMAQSIAKEIVSNAEVEIDDGGAVKDLRDQMIQAFKGKRIYVPAQYRSDVLDWNDFQKRYRNIFTFRNDGTPIDQIYTEIANTIPGLLDPNINNIGDMLNEMADKWDALQPTYGNPFERYENEATNHFANKILQSALDGTLRRVAPTYADVMNERIERLREEKNDRIEEIRQQGIAAKQEAVAKEKAAKWAKRDQTAKYYRDMAERAAVRRKNKETKTKINKLINDLHSRLVHPTEKKYVPADLVQNTIKILEMIDLDTGRESVRVQERLALLQQQYAALKSDQTFAGYAYDPIMEEAITNMAKVVGNTPLRKMSSTQLDTVLNTLKMLEHTVRTAVKDTLYGEEWNFYEAARAAVKATKENAGTRNNILGNAEDWYTTNTMRPEVVFERFGGFVKDSEWEQIYDMLDKAQRYGMDLQMRFAMTFDELLKDKKQVAKLTSTKAEDLLDIGLKDEDGEAIKVTKDFALFVYMNLFNEDNIQHIMRGGIEVPELKEYLAGKGDRGYGKGSRRAVGISQRLSDINHAIEDTDDPNEKAALLQEKEDVLKEGMEHITNLRINIESKMTEYDHDWVKAWWKFNQMATEVLNETSMQTYGFKKFNVEQYFPIITDRNFLNTPMETVIKDMSLENAGFTKERIHASTPIKMMGLSDVINMQANRTAQYASIMPAVRAFNKIYNKTMPGYSTSVKDTLNKKFGDSATKFVENLMADLQGGRRSEFTIFDKLRGRMAQATLSLNPRVALAQTASFPTAAAELGWKPVLKALAKGGKNDRMISAADRELIAKYSSALWYRSRGYSNVELGDVKNMQQAQHKVMDKLGWAMNWINFMDSATVGRLWYAAQYYVDDHYKALQKGSDAYYEKVAEMFNRTIENTQPNYTTLQRPELLRSPDALKRQLGMFMTQRLQNQSIMYGAAAKYLKYRADFQAGKNGVTQADVREMRLRAVNAATSQVAAAATIAIFKFICDALLHRMNAYRKDEDKTLDAESISLGILNSFAESIVSNAFFGSELYSAVKSAITKETYYGMELSGVSTMFETLENAVKFAQKPSWSMAKKLGDSIAQYLGIPEENAVKIGQAIWYHMQDAMNGKFGSFEAGVQRTDSQNAKLLTEAMLSGNEKKIEKYSATYEDEDEKLDAVRNYIKSQYVPEKGKAQKIGKQEAVKLLVESGMYQKDAEKKVQEWTCEIVTGIPFNKIKDEFMAGNITQARVSELLQKYGSRDKDSADKTARSYACEKAIGYSTSELKDAYLNDRIDSKTLTSALRTYGGLDVTKANNRVLHYDYLKLKPDSEISENRAVAYMKTLKKQGFTPAQWEDALDKVTKMSEGDNFNQDDAGLYIKGKNYSDKKAQALWDALLPKSKITYDEWSVKYSADNAGTGKGAGNGSVSQAELGSFLVGKVDSGEMTAQEAEHYWKTFQTTTKLTFDQYVVKYKADKAGKGKSGNNGYVSQKELGPYLVKQINAGKMTMDEANGYWKVFFSKSSTTFKRWLKKNHYKIG